MYKPLVARSALAAVAAPAHHGAPGTTGATLVELTGLSLVGVSARGGQIAALSAAVEREFGAALPIQPGRTAQSSAAFIWSGCDRWLVIGTETDALAQRLASCTGALGSVTDLTGSRTIMRISGRHARDGLAKVVPIDLDEMAFTDRSAALTIAAGITVALWQTDSTPTYEIACPRSYATSLWRVLLASFAEYGCDVLR